MITRPARSSDGRTGVAGTAPLDLDRRLADLLVRHRGRASGRDWLAEQLAPLGTRRHLATGDCLFSVGDRARYYYLVEKGRLLMHRRPPRGPAAVRLAAAGDLLIFDCGGTHVAAAHAIGATSVLAVDRRRVEMRSLLEPALRGVLQAVHARELGMILESLGVAGGAAAEIHDARRPEPQWLGVTARVPRGRWQPYLAHQSEAA